MFWAATGPRCRVISDNDYAGDPDGLFQLAHLLLSPAVEVRAVIGSHLAPGDVLDDSGASAAHAVQRAGDVLDLLALRGRIPLYQGSELALADASSPWDSAGADAIIAEAMRTDVDSPLYLTCGGGLTELASAYLREPRIAQRLTAVWIGGPEYPDLVAPPPGAGDPEYNLAIDLTAAQVVFDSAIPLWQVPRDAYRQTLIGLAELQAQLAAAGPLGDYLAGALQGTFALLGKAGLQLGEAYALGDNPLVLLTALQSGFHPDTSSSRYVTRPAPAITDDGGYAPRSGGRSIRVYTQLDVRLMLGDLLAKLTR